MQQSMVPLYGTLKKNIYKDIFLYYNIMSKTIDLLVDSCMSDLFPPDPVIADYFGIENASNTEHLSIILGLYQGMIKIKGMNKDIVENAYKKNKLDKLIHDSYRVYGSSGYYRMFCEKNIIIGKTRL